MFTDYFFIRIPHKYPQKLKIDLGKIDILVYLRISRFESDFSDGCNVTAYLSQVSLDKHLIFRSSEPHGCFNMVKHYVLHAL